MSECPCCNAALEGDFPDFCNVCGATFDHEGEVRNGGWKPVVIVTKHGEGCDGGHG